MNTVWSESYYTIWFLTRREGNQRLLQSPGMFLWSKQGNRTLGKQLGCPRKWFWGRTIWGGEKARWSIVQASRGMPLCPKGTCAATAMGGARDCTLHVGLAQSPPWGWGGGEVLRHSEPCKNWDWKVQSLRSVRLSGTSEFCWLSSHFAALAYICQPRPGSSYSQAEW